MQTQSPSTDIRGRSPGTTLKAVQAGGLDPLAEIDVLMRKRLDDEQRTADRSAQVDADRSKFVADFTDACDQRVRPPMEAILERLRRNGGGGLIEERPEDLTRHHSHRLILWMSLSDEITGTPRQDRHPYLQLDANVDKRLVTISEGDMWNGQGGNHSGRVGERPLTEITETLITDEALAILRRSLHSPGVASLTEVSTQRPQDRERVKT
jgi:hypothetical protein